MPLLQTTRLRPSWWSHSFSGGLSNALMTLALLCAPWIHASAQTWQTVYATNFDRGVPSGWSGTPAPLETNLLSTLDPVNFPSVTALGRFNNNTVTLNLTNLPPHSQLRVTYDFYTLQSWDGNGAVCCGPDLFDLTIDSNRVMHATFTVYSFQTQSYPEDYPASNPVGSGGFVPGGYGKYTISRATPHTSATATVKWQDFLTQGVLDESWAIANVNVEVLDEAGVGPPRTFVVSFTGWANDPAACTSSWDAEPVQHSVGMVNLVESIRGLALPNVHAAAFTYYQPEKYNDGTCVRNPSVTDGKYPQERYTHVDAEAWLRQYHPTSSDHIIVVGHSRGGARAYYFVDQIFGNSPPLRTDTLILLDPVDVLLLNPLHQQDLVKEPPVSHPGQVIEYRNVNVTVDSNTCPYYTPENGLAPANPTGFQVFGALGDIVPFCHAFIDDLELAHRTVLDAIAQQSLPAQAGPPYLGQIRLESVGHGYRTVALGCIKNCLAVDLTFRNVGVLVSDYVHVTGGIELPNGQRRDVETPATVAIAGSTFVVTLYWPNVPTNIDTLPLHLRWGTNLETDSSYKVIFPGGIDTFVQQ